MENGKSIAAQSFKGVKSSEDDKLVPMTGSGKEFDALVTTLKQAIKDGLIDKENLHRLSHGLGVKADELANMIGLENKDEVHAEDQDESPEVAPQAPEVYEPKAFKDFRAETQNRLPVQEQMSSQQINQIRADMRRSGASSSEINARVNELRRLSRSSGSRTSVAAAGRNTASQLTNVMHDPMIQRRMKMLRQKGM
jgi:hypothetical protein